LSYGQSCAARDSIGPVGQRGAIVFSAARTACCRRASHAPSGRRPAAASGR